MSELIPWEQAAPPRALRANSNETVREVCDQLRDLGGHAQYNVPILIDLPDGHVAPTSAPMLRKLAQERGASILRFKLGDLLTELCPEPWSVESRGPAYREAAQAAARRRLPVLVTQAGQPVGLMPPPGRQALFVTRLEGAFDLFDEPLSRDDLSASEFVTVALDDTVAQVVEVLKTQREPEKTHVVVKVDDGSFQLVDRNLGSEVEHFATDVWPKSLRQFASNLRPAEARQLDDLGRKQAQSLTRRHSLVLLDDEGQVVGLILSGLRARAIQQVRFDLFDEPLANFEPAQVKLPVPEVVWATLDTLLAQVAADLKKTQDAARAYIAIEKNDGSLEAVAAWELNRRLDGFGEDALGKPLREIVPDLPAVASRTFDTVGRQQVQVLLEQKKRLLLTVPGQRPVLLAEEAEPTTYRARYTLDICNVAQATLDSYLPQEQFLMEPRSVTMEAQPPATQPRYVNLWFEDVPRSEALVLGKTYDLALNIGALREMSIIDWEHTPGGPRAIVEPQEKDAYLYVNVFSQDFDVPEPTQALKLPREGDTSPLYFKVAPLRRTRSGETANLAVCLYYRTYLVQTFQVRVEVAAPGEPKRSDEPQSARLIHARSASFPEMEKLPSRDLSLTITRAGPDLYRFTFLVDPDPGDPAAAQSAIALSCRVGLTRDDLTHLITKARRQLYNVVQAFDLLQEHDVRTYRKATRALAQVGRQLYLKLFESPSAQALRDWMEESLPDGSTIQIVDLAGDFVFPWSLVFTEQPWSDDKPVDVKKFWGWRYELVVLTDRLLDTYRQARTEIAADEPLRVSVGMYERLVGTTAQKEFFADLEAQTDRQVVTEIQTTRRKMSQDLRAADHDLYYFFCHGYTERIATDIQLDADLVGHFAQIAANSFGDKSKVLREHLDDLFDVSDSWLRLTRGKIPLAMLKETAPDEFSRHPLVFLNMCESAQVLPSLSDGFVPFFLQRGARAVIGTECSMNTIFADDFARAFLARFFQGEPVGGILLALRRRYLEQGNPLALAYTLYCDADLRLSKRLLPADSALASLAA